MRLEIIENAGKRRTKKRRPARRRASTTYRKRPVRRRRRNPSTFPMRRRRSAARRNPRGLFGFDFKQAGTLVGGMVAARYLSGMIGGMVGLPTTGPMGILTKLGTVFAVGFGASQLLGRKVGDTMLTGGLTLVLFDLFNEYLAPSLGLGRYYTGTRNRSALGNLRYLPMSTGQNRIPYGAASVASAPMIAARGYR